jgi:hypothetical protein
MGAPLELVSNAADHLSTKQPMTPTEHRVLGECHPRRCSTPTLIASTRLLHCGVVRDAALAAELLRRMAHDQEARAAVTSTHLDEEVVARVGAVDADNTRWFKELLDRSGWPARSVVGDEGALAAWLLAQHADQDLDFQRRCLVLLEQAVHDGEADAAHWAYLVDRVRCAEGRPQLYGTQFWNGPYGQDPLGPQPIEDLDRLDQRRRTVGLGSFAEYEQLMNETNPS